MSLLADGKLGSGRLTKDGLPPCDPGCPATASPALLQAAQLGVAQLVKLPSSSSSKKKTELSRAGRREG